MCSVGGVICRWSLVKQDTLVLNGIV